MPEPNDPTVTIAELATRLRSAAVAALTALTGAADGASMCAIARSGRSFPAAKYHEGRAAALGQLRRAKGGATALGELSASWAAQAEAMAARDGLSPDWAAYFAGACDALAEVGELLQAGG